MKLTKKLKALIFAGIGIPVALAAPVVPVELKPIVWYVKDDGHCYVDFNDRGKVLTKEMSCEEYWKTAKTPNYPQPKTTKHQSFLAGLDAEAAISYDATSTTAQNSVSSYSWSHTTAGSNKILLVGSGQRDPTSLANASSTSVTYNSVPMTLIRVVNGANAGEWMQSEFYYLIAPTAGSNTITVTLAGTASRVSSGAISLNGVDQTSPVEDAAANAATSTTPTVNVTTATNNAWVVSTLTTRSASGDTYTNGSGQTQQWNSVNIALRGLGDSEGPVSPAGTVTMDGTLSASVRWLINAASIKAAAVSTPPDPGTTVIFE